MTERADLKKGGLSKGGADAPPFGMRLSLYLPLPCRKVISLRRCWRMGGGRGWACIKPALRQARPRGGLFQKSARASSFFSGNSRVMFLSMGGSFPKTGKPSPQERARAFSVTGSFAGSGPAPGPGQATRPGAVPPGRRSCQQRGAGRPAQRKPPGFRSRRVGPLS